MESSKSTCQVKDCNNVTGSLLGDVDLHLFREGNHTRLYSVLGAHLVTGGGTWFSLWAPNAYSVSVIGDFNGWNRDLDRLKVRGDSSGIFEGIIPTATKGSLYKFHIRSRVDDYRVDKADPFARSAEIAPRTASIVWQDDYRWNDRQWMLGRAKTSGPAAPISIYEVHLGSWRRSGDSFLSYPELARQLGAYVRECGFTHVELLPVMEHPFYGSWGYQSTGYFAPTSRYGTPEEFKAFVDHLHDQGIGIVLDWVPSHFPNDEHGLGYFDGTHLFEHADPRQGFHPDWNSYIFNYGRNEIRSFLLSSARFWLEEYHIDGLRVDAVASMLYLDYSREEGEWIPNALGGRENLEAISFLKRMNELLYSDYPDILLVAEESTAWPMVSRPTFLGGLGFGAKWDMGWMHDTLSYLSHEPIYRRYHHGEITFRQVYAYNENFILPLSHDEVTHGKGSLLGKMVGDDWQKFANLRLLYGYMYAMPGKKLLFMGAEIAQPSEWNHDRSIDWTILDDHRHSRMRQWVGDLNRVYKDQTALHRGDFEASGFRWVDFQDADSNVLCFLRQTDDPANIVLVVCHFSPVLRDHYRVGVPRLGYWKEILNSDAEIYGGSGRGNLGGVDAEVRSQHNFPASLNLVLPPLSILFFTCETRHEVTDRKEQKP